MDDCELLWYAEKASGVTVSWSDLYGRFERFKTGDDGFVVYAGPWNPLEDDGDALRLAVELGIEISPCPECDSVTCEPKGRPHSVITTEALDDYGVRRAIVRAAAEIGRIMP